MTTATLHELLTHRDESMVTPRTRRRTLVRAWRRTKAIVLPAALRAVLAVMTFISGHALVLAGCSAFVISAAMLSPILGWFTAGAALFFLEARRR